MSAVSCVLLTAALLPGGQDREAKPPDAGDCAPDFALPNQDGKKVRLSSYRGKQPVVLVFFRGSF